MNITEPERFAVHLKGFLQEVKPDVYLTKDLNDFDFLVTGSVTTLMAKMLKMYKKDIFEINFTEFHICEVFVVIAAKLMLNNLDVRDSESNAVLLSYYGTFIHKFGKEEVTQRCKDAVRPVNHFYQQNPKLHNLIEINIARYIERPSYRRMHKLSDLFKFIVNNAIEVQRSDDDVLH